MRTTVYYFKPYVEKAVIALPSFVRSQNNPSRQAVPEIPAI